MTLAELLTVLDESGLRTRPTAPGGGAGPPDPAVSSIAYDSRAVTPAALFVALRGAQADGSAFAGQAIAKGAVAVIAETGAPDACPVPWITVSDGRRAIALLAAHFYGHQLEIWDPRRARRQVSRFPDRQCPAAPRSAPRGCRQSRTVIIRRRTNWSA